MSKARKKYIENGAHGAGANTAQSTEAGDRKFASLKEWLGNNITEPAQEAVQQTNRKANQTAAQSTEAGGSGADYDRILSSYRELAKSQLDKLDLQRTEARRETSVLSDRLARYLPYLRRSENTQGSGLADTTDIAAYNQLLNRYSSVDADFSEKQADILNSYRQTAASMAKEAADRKWQSEEAEANRKWQTEENEANRTWQDEQIKTQAATGSYSDAATALGSWFENMADSNGKISASDLSKLRSFADVFKEKLNAADQAQLDVLLSGYESFVRTRTEQDVYDRQSQISESQYRNYIQRMTEAEKLQTYQGGLASATVPASTGAGRNFDITLGGKTYGVQIKDTVTDATVLQAAQIAGEDQPFVLGGKMYMMTRGSDKVAAGTVFEIEGQFWSRSDYTKLLDKIQSSQTMVDGRANSTR